MRDAIDRPNPEDAALVPGDDFVFVQNSAHAHRSRDVDPALLTGSDAELARKESRATARVFSSAVPNLEIHHQLVTCFAAFLAYHFTHLLNCI